MLSMKLSFIIFCVSLLLIKCHSICNESQPCTPPSTSPTYYPTVTAILKYQVKAMIKFEFTFDDTKNGFNIIQSLKNSTIYILNEAIIGQQIKCYSSDYITDIEVLVIYEENGAIAKKVAEINATILLCDVINTNKLLTYFQNDLSGSQLIESKYENHNNFIHLIAHSSKLMATSSDYIPDTSTTEALEQIYVSKAGMIEETLLIILLCVFCVCVFITIPAVIIRKRYNEKQNIKRRIKTIDIFEMPKKHLKTTEMIQPSIKISINNDSDSENADKIISRKKLPTLSDTIVIRNNNPVMVTKGNRIDVPKMRSPGMSFVTAGFIMDVNNYDIDENDNIYEEGFKLKSIGSEFDQLDGDTIQ